MGLIAHLLKEWPTNPRLYLVLKPALGVILQFHDLAHYSQQTLTDTQTSIAGWVMDALRQCFEVGQDDNEDVLHVLTSMSQV